MFVKGNIDKVWDDEANLHHDVIPGVGVIGMNNCNRAIWNQIEKLKEVRRLMIGIEFQLAGKTLKDKVGNQAAAKEAIGARVASILMLKHRFQVMFTSNNPIVLWTVPARISTEQRGSDWPAFVR